jgi:superfamily II DNA or RNA helicase
MDPVNERRWCRGQHVFLRGRRWRIEEDTPFGDCQALRLTAADLKGPFHGRTFLLPFDRPRAIAESINGLDILPPRRWLRTLREKATAVRPCGGLSAASTCSIDLLPYQLEPALAMLRHGCPRVLIADAVGLGKTIQAGLIIRQLSAERESLRALVVTPAGLRDQWAAELASRFALRVETVTSAWLARAVYEVPADIGPWALPGVHLCSFEFIRRPEVLRPLEDLTWDLLVVDEAHAATPASARRAAVNAIALRSRRVILLTATPHGGDDEQFRSLCRIGRAEEHPDAFVMFCRSRADIGTAARRRSVLLPVRLSAAERRVHRLLERYTACVCAESRSTANGHARLAAIVLRKRALSSAGSLAVSCRRRLSLLTSLPEAPPGEQLLLPLDDGDALEDAEPNFILGARGLANAAREQRWLEVIVDAAEDAAHRESKIRCLRRLVERIKEPIIIFTEFRDTLVRLQAALDGLGREVCVLHGGMTPWERSAAQERFNRGGSLLVATDAASEGLNLHSHCRTVVHFELPWSPSRLEQRTGRVDRIGQRAVVHEIMLVAADTAERLVLAPLVKRAARARSRVAGGFGVLETLSESRIAAAVMDGAPIESVTAAFDQDLSPPPDSVREEAQLEAVRLATLRNGIVTPRRRRSGSARVTATLVGAKRRLLLPGLIRVFVLTLTGRDGTTVHSELVAVQESARLQLPITREWLEDLMRTPAVGGKDAMSVLALFGGRITTLVQLFKKMSSAVADREKVIALPTQFAARQLVQAGLFDRRVIRADQERERAAAAIREETDQHIQALDARLPLTPSLTLAALLLVEDRRPR